MPRPHAYAAWRRFLAIALTVCGLAAAPRATSAAPRDAKEPLARYLPAENLIVLIEHDGLETHAEAWKATAAYKMLTETKLGAMLDDVGVQLTARALPPPAPISAKDGFGLLKHLANKGFVIGLVGPVGPAPKGIVVIRDAGKNEAFKQLIARAFAMVGPEGQKVEMPGGRTVTKYPGMGAWWFEKDDFVLSINPGEAKTDVVIDVLDGRAPSALKNPTYQSLAAAAPGETAVGRLFVDISAIPVPMPPQARKLGLDGIKRVELTWAIRGPGLVGTFGVVAPRPRRGLLALFDQPPLPAGTALAMPKGVVDSTIVSIDPVKIADTIMSLIEGIEGNPSAQIKQAVKRVELATGVKIREDLLAKLGPRMAFFAPAGGGASIFGLGMWFYPPNFSMVAEVRDVAAFEKTLDRVMLAANRELKALGAMAPPPRGQLPRPGTSAAEFRKLAPPAHGYVLTIPPSVLPTPAGLRPTIAVDAERGVVAIAGTTAAALKALPVLELKEAGAPVPVPGTIAVSQGDPSHILPEILINIPSIVQFIGFAASQGGPNGPKGPPFSLEIDPDAIPEADALRPYLFPSVTTVVSDDSAIRVSLYTAFPFPAPQLNAGAEVPVLIALLLPAVQAAREAARRAQCVNNERQIGLALMNYVSTHNKYPAAAIASNTGKPLLSWRVAILPYLDQMPLYEQFHLDEPWDSPHNKALIPLMPSVFRCPSRNDPAKSGTTTYCGFVGKETALEPSGGAGLASFRDGTSNTILFVEASNPVPWTKPEDLPFDAKGRGVGSISQIFGAGSNHPGGFNANMCDGSVRFIKNTISPMLFRALITKSGREVVDPNAF